MSPLDDDMRAVMAETSAMLARGELVPERIEPWWETRRPNEQTPDYLGRVLDEAGLPEMAERARLGHFDDFHAPAGVADGLEMVRLVAELRGEARKVTDPAGNPLRAETRTLRRERFAVIENAVRRGEFDATKAESERWAASKDGQDTFRELLASTRRAPPQPGRNEPCPCGSGRKWKRCHGA